MTTAEVAVERWTYLGKRLTAKGQLRQMWRSPKGEFLLPAALGPAAIGAVFAVTRPEADSPSYYTAGQYAPRLVEQESGLTEDEALENAVRERAATDEYNRVNLMRRAAKRDSPIQEEVDRLKRRTMWMSQAERKAFVTMLVQELL